MAYIHFATSRGFTVDDVRMIEEKVGDRGAIDGLLVESYGQDGDVMRHVTIWESKAHKDRYEAELLLPAFQAAGIAAAVGASTDFAEYEAARLYQR
jgi:hypothetical protein